MDRRPILPAFAEGFRLVGRHPLAVLAWGGVYVLLTLIPVGAYFAFVGPALMEQVTAAARGVVTPPPPDTGWAGVIQLIQIASSLASVAIVYSAIYRAILRPNERSFGFLRLGRDEFNVGVTVVVLYLLLMAALLILVVIIMIPVGIVAALTAGGADVEAGIGVGAVIAMLVVFGALLFFGVRFGMAVPMTFAERRICIFDGWKFTRGYSGPLVGLALLQVLLVFGAEIVLILAIGAMGFADAARIGLDNLDSISDAREFVRGFMPTIAVGGALYLLLMMVVTPVLAAPWARVYQIIDSSRAERETTVFE